MIWLLNPKSIHFTTHSHSLQAIYGIFICLPRQIVKLTVAFVFNFIEFSCLCEHTKPFASLICISMCFFFFYSFSHHETKFISIYPNIQKPKNCVLQKKKNIVNREWKKKQKQEKHIEAKPENIFFSRILGTLFFVTFVVDWCATLQY